MLVKRNDVSCYDVLIVGSVSLVGRKSEGCHHRLARSILAQRNVAQQSTLVFVLVVAAQLTESDVTLGQLAVLTLLRLHVHRFGLCNHLTNLSLHNG